MGRRKCGFCKGFWIFASNKLFFVKNFINLRDEFVCLCDLATPCVYFHCTKQPLQINECRFNQTNYLLYFSHRQTIKNSRQERRITFYRTTMTWHWHLKSHKQKHISVPKIIPISVCILTFLLSLVIIVIVVMLMGNDMVAMVGKGRIVKRVKNYSL